jgi:hypothetical protein
VQGQGQHSDDRANQGTSVQGQGKPNWHTCQAAAGTLLQRVNELIAQDTNPSAAKDMRHIQKWSKVVAD